MSLLSVEVMYDFKTLLSVSLNINKEQRSQIAKEKQSKIIDIIYSDFKIKNYLQLHFVI